MIGTDTITSHPREADDPGLTTSADGTAPAARTRLRVLTTALLLSALAAVMTFTLHRGDNHSAPGRLLLGYGIAWALFAAAVWTIRKVPARAATVLVLIGSAAIALAGLTAPPRTSDDMFRYAWDGRVQAAGISPGPSSTDCPGRAAGAPSC
ncbi:hypothetical protein [Streptomyces flavofungini]|uniref:hypothetical protein n=1 Tax=Streptomyces flavofungini TaxID=68200 RepID=UPI0034DE8B33